MRWEVKTEKKTYVVASTSSRDAVDYVRNKKKDASDLKGVKLLPKNTIDRIKSSWKNFFGK